MSHERMLWLSGLSLKELGEQCSCSPEAQDGETPSCDACFVAGAVSAGISRAVIRGERSLPAAPQAPAEDCDANELDDPKHATYRERMLDAADRLRKSRKEGGGI